MNCPSCNRPNAEDVSYCDYCGTPLTAPATGKRKTEFEPVPAAGPVRKRVTEFEPSAEPPAPANPAARRIADPFDPFGTPASAPPAMPRPAAPAPPVTPTPPAAPPPRKKATEYIPGNRDPFAAPPAGPSPPATAAAQNSRQNQAAIGRRIVGWVITFDEHPDGLSFLLREGRNVVGRDEESDIAVGWDHTVSGTHAFLIWRLGRARVADANTQNGTFLNEEDVLGQIEVHDGDVLRVGRTRLLIRLLDQAKVSALWDPKASAGEKD